jgi:hypothetical protein
MTEDSSVNVPTQQTVMEKTEKTTIHNPQGVCRVIRHAHLFTPSQLVWDGIFVILTESWEADPCTGTCFVFLEDDNLVDDMGRQSEIRAQLILMKTTVNETPTYPFVISFVTLTLATSDPTVIVLSMPRKLPGQA